MPRQGSQRVVNCSQNDDVYTQCTQQSQISKQELGHLVDKCVTKILAENFSLRSFKKTELLHNAKLKGKAAKELMEVVKKKLLDVYGLTLLEDDNKFVLINPKSQVLDQFKTSTSTPKHVFLGIVLTLIVHNSDEINSEQLKTYFSKLSVDIEGEDVYFGNIKKLLIELEQQLYLEKIIKPVPSQPSEIIYKWGIRAKHEVKKKDLIPLVAIMYHMAPEDLPRPLVRLYSND